MGWGWEFQASSQGLVFLMTSLHPGSIQEPKQSCLITTNMLPVPCSHHLGIYQDFQSLESGTRAENSRYILYYYTDEKKGNASIKTSICIQCIHIGYNILATWCEELTHWKRLWCWERLRVGGEGATEDEMVGWHHWLNGHEFEQALGDGEGQGSLACCCPWGHKELDLTEQLNNSPL